MPKPHGARKPFNLVLSDDEYDQLKQISAATGQSYAAVLRGALLTLWSMKIARVPLCAVGTPCFVPQMHIQQMPGLQAPAMAPAGIPAPANAGAPHHG